MLFNSRTDIRRVDQGPMEIFDETLRKREQVPLPSNIPDEGTLQNVDTETVLANGKFQSDVKTSWKYWIKLIY